MGVTRSTRGGRLIRGDIRSMGDEYSGEGTVREGDGLEMMVERSRRRMGKMVSVVKKRE